MRHTSVQSTENNPDYIHHHTEATATVRLANLRAEWPQAQQSEFENLNSERNTNNCYKQGKRACKISNCALKATKYQPQNITYKFIG